MATENWLACDYRSDAGVCRIASDLAGCHAAANPSACAHCQRDKVSQVEVTVTLAIHAANACGRKETARQLLAAHTGKFRQIVPADPDALDRVQRGHGVGSQLWRLLSDLGVQHTPTCSCVALAREMNDRGPAWCKASRTQLAEQMRTNATAYGWGTVAKAAAAAVLSGLAWRINPADVYGSLLDEAIRRAEAAATARQKLILASHLCPGDLLTMTAALESLHATYPDRYTTDVRTGHPDIWKANPHVTPIADDDPDARAIQLHYPLIQRCNQVSAPFLAGYTEYLGQQLGKPLSLTTNRPHLYLTPAERSRPRKELWPGAPDLSRPFWIVNAGIKQDFTVKQWPVEHYQAVIDATRHKIQWVQIGLAADNHPRLRHVISMLDTGPPMRPLILLAHHAAGGMGPVTFLQHLMAAWQKPYLCLAGGREPTTWTQYQAQHTFHTLGQLDCCRTQSCWRGRVLPLGDGHEADQSLCSHPVQDTRFSRPVGRCMAMIRPAELIAVLERHLEVNP